MKKLTILLLFFIFSQHSYSQVEPRIVEKRIERFDNDLNKFVIYKLESFEYDHFENLIFSTKSSYSSGELFDSTTFHYSYDNRNNIISEITTKVYTFSFFVDYKNYIFHEYNLQNQVTKTLEKRYNPNVDLWITERWNEFSYNSNGCIESKTSQENSIVASENITSYTTDENCNITQENFIPDLGSFTTFNYLDDYGSNTATFYKTSSNGQSYPEYHYEYLYNEYGDQTVNSLLMGSWFSDTSAFYSTEFHYNYIFDPSTNQIVTKFSDKYIIHYPDEPNLQFKYEYNYEYNCDGSVKIENGKNLTIDQVFRTLYFYEGQLDCIDFEQNLNVTISPNPSLGKIEIQSNLLASGNTTLHIFSIDGKLLGKELLVSRNLKQEVDLTYLQNGIYILQFQNGNHVKTTKLIISK